MSAKWRVLLTRIGTSPMVADKIVKACCALHNFLIDESQRENAGNPTAMADRDGDDGAWRDMVGQGLAPVAVGRRNNRAPNDALAQRLDLVRYFTNEGALDWQDERIGFNESTDFVQI